MIHGVCNILEPGPTQNEKNTNAGSSPTTMAMVVSAGPWMLVSFASYRESHHPIDEQRSGTMEEHRPELPQLLSWPHSESFYSTLEICTCNSPHPCLVIHDAWVMRQLRRHSVAFRWAAWLGKWRGRRMARSNGTTA
jgi:hypothetical protein